MIKEKMKIMKFWKDHFSKLLNREKCKGKLETIKEIDQFELLQDIMKMKDA